MAYRRRRRSGRRRSRRYRRRSRRYRKKAGRPNNRPYGKSYGNPFRAPRSNRCFHYPMKRNDCMRSTVSAIINNPIREEYSSAGVADAGKICKWIFQPFNWAHPLQPYNGDGVWATVGKTNIKYLPQYRFAQEIQHDFKEYSPLKAYYDIIIRQTPEGFGNSAESPVIGCFITSRLSTAGGGISGDYIVPVYNGATNHSELETWKSFPGMSHYSANRSNSGYASLKAKRFKGVLKAIDFQSQKFQTNATSVMVSTNNYFVFGTDNHVGTFPAICIWYCDPKGDGATPSKSRVAFEIQIRVTLLFRCRKMLNLDPLSFTVE